MRIRLALLAFFILALSSPAVFAQSTTSGSSTTYTAAPAMSKPARDNFLIEFTYEGWSKVPDSIKTGGLGRGANVYLMYDFPIQKSNFSFGAGIGIGSANIYLNNQQVVFTDTGAAGTQAHFGPEAQDYKKFKLTTAYLEAPFELRYFSNKQNRNKAFKAALGLRVGTLVGAHTKDSRTVEGTRVIDKVNTKRFLNSWRYSGTLRVGYGNFSIFGSYDLNTLFKEGAGPGVTPYSVGIAITAL